MRVWDDIDGDLKNECDIKVNVYLDDQDIKNLFKIKEDYGEMSLSKIVRIALRTMFKRIELGENGL